MVHANDQTNEAKAMGFFSRDIQTMDDLFVQTLRDIYYAEQKIVQALPEMIESCANPRLKSAFEHFGSNPTTDPQARKGVRNAWLSSQSDGLPGHRWDH
jgi:hypothetical protein